MPSKCYLKLRAQQIKVTLRLEIKKVKEVEEEEEEEDEEEERRGEAVVYA